MKLTTICDLLLLLSINKAYVVILAIFIWTLDLAQSAADSRPTPLWNFLPRWLGEAATYKLPDQAWKNWVYIL